MIGAAPLVLDGTVPAERIAALHPAGIVDAGHDTVVFAEPVNLGTDAGYDIGFLRLLRDCMAANLRVSWTAGGAPPVDPTLLCHLQPPRAAVAGAAPAVVEHTRAWRDRYGYGRCYYRRGPGFVTVRDTRDPMAPARYVLDDEAAVRALPATEEVTRVTGAPAEVVDLLELLLAEGLAVRLNDLATLLPSRMRHWPVPFNAV